MVKETLSEAVCLGIQAQKPHAKQTTWLLESPKIPLAASTAYIHYMLLCIGTAMYWHCHVLALPCIGTAMYWHCHVLALPCIGTAMYWHCHVLALPCISTAMYWHCHVLALPCISTAMYWHCHVLALPCISTAVYRMAALLQSSVRWLEVWAAFTAVFWLKLFVY